tara:strand:+ start:1803 stop:2411 length:609 start_codon:yes stop_codon:yes gene_type:complete
MTKSNKEIAVDALLSLLEKENYNLITIEKVARRAKLKKENIKADFLDLDSIVHEFLNNIDLEVGDLTREDANTKDPKDIIFNIILNKLELYSRRRNAIINLIGKESNFRNKYFFQMTNITRIFDNIYINDKQKNLQKLSRDIGLVHIYKQTIDQWILDDDMSKIMSFLDQKLIKSGKIFERISKPIKFVDSLVSKFSKSRSD